MPAAERNYIAEAIRRRILCSRIHREKGVRFTGCCNSLREDLLYIFCSHHEYKFNLYLYKNHKID